MGHPTARSTGLGCRGDAVDRAFMTEQIAPFRVKLTTGPPGPRGRETRRSAERSRQRHFGVCRHRLSWSEPGLGSGSHREV